jgi:hypothetical protein
MLNNDVINQMKVFPPNVTVRVFGAGIVTKIETGTDENGDYIQLTAQSKAMDAMQSVQELKSEVCRCGNEKKRGQSFCLSCYRSLPPGLKKALYNRVGDGYEQSYTLACKTLDERRSK